MAYSLIVKGKTLSFDQIRKVNSKLVENLEVISLFSLSNEGFKESASFVAKALVAGFKITGESEIQIVNDNPEYSFKTTIAFIESLSQGFECEKAKRVRGPKQAKEEKSLLDLLGDEEEVKEEEVKEEAKKETPKQGKK